MDTMKIVLASASPRRKELLEKLGLEFEVDPGNHAEQLRPTSDPHALAREISFKKASVVAGKHTDALIIAADTFIVFGDTILGKPENKTESLKMLTTLNGKSHVVITGFSIIDTESGKAISRSTGTTVHMKELTPREIDAYVKSQEPLGKAGAYAIQGIGAVIIDRIEGDYFNVVGLPLATLTEALKEFGVYVLK
jgi:septum formation protein